VEFYKDIKRLSLHRCTPLLSLIGELPLTHIRKKHVASHGKGNRKKNVLADTMLGFSVLPWVWKGQAVRAES